MKRVIGFIGLAIGLVWVSATPVQAITLSLSDGVTTVSCADGDACDVDATAGAVTYVSAVGNFTFNVSTGITYPALGTTAQPQLDLHSVDLSSSTGGTLTILVSEVDYIGDGSATVSLGTSVTGTAGGTADFETFLDDGNALFAQTSSLGALGPFSGAFLGETSGGVAATAPFSLTAKATIVHGAGFNSTNFGMAVGPVSVPEPTSLFLLGSGLLGLGLWRRNRIKG